MTNGPRHGRCRQDEFYACGVVELGFCQYAAISPLFGGIGRDRLVGLPSGGLPVDFTRIGWKARIGAIVVPGRRKLGGSLGPLLAAVFVAPYGRRHIALFTILAFTAIMVMIPVGIGIKFPAPVEESGRRNA